MRRRPSPGRARLDRDLICTDRSGAHGRGRTLDLERLHGGLRSPATAAGATGTGVGILLEGEGARLSDGAVTGCAWPSRRRRRRPYRPGPDRRRPNQGILVESGRNRVLDSHILRGLEDAAVQVDGSDNLLRCNEIAGSDDQGFEINGNDNQVIGNRIGAVAEGVQLTGERNHALRNQIIGATDRGIEVRGLVEPTGAHVILDNLIADGVDGIATLESSNGNRVSGTPSTATAIRASSSAPSTTRSSATGCC